MGLREIGSTGIRLGLLSGVGLLGMGKFWVQLCEVWWVEGPIPKEILELEGVHCELRVRSYSQPPYFFSPCLKGNEQSGYDNLVGVRGRIEVRLRGCGEG